MSTVATDTKQDTPNKAQPATLSWNSIRGTSFAMPSTTLPNDNQITTLHFTWGFNYPLYIVGTPEQIIEFTADNTDLAMSNEEFFMHHTKNNLFAGKPSKTRFFLREFYWSFMIAPDDPTKLILLSRHFITSCYIGAPPRVPVPKSK